MTGNLSRTVLRGAGARESACLPDSTEIFNKFQHCRNAPAITPKEPAPTKKHSPKVSAFPLNKQSNHNTC
ncbi:hypothetical protein RKD56_004165 [Priestia megaterium]